MAEQQKLSAVPLTDVRIDDVFWALRQRVAREKTLPHNFRMCEETGRIDHFAKAAGRMEGKFEGYFFNDSDVYKTLEGAAYALMLERDPELERYVDDVTAKIAAAQEPDGYLNTYFALTDSEERWSNLRVRHELYCAGHLIEAAVAHYQATGRRTLLDVAVKFADLIDSLFGPDKRHDIPGHEEIELALVKLARLTGEERYNKLAEFFIEQRGRAEQRDLYGDYCQDHLPVREQSEIVGHAVRAMYLYSAVADIAALTGDHGYMDAMDRIWEDVVQRKMYITGGIGPSAHNEGFTVPYDLPNDTAYAETCASIGMILWNHRLNLLHGDARYADVLERVLYNGLLSGISLDGVKFFYTNPLGSKGNHHRRPWYTCACCPPNVLRVLLSLGQYIYAYSDDAVYVNLYVGSSVKIPVAGTTVTLRQETKYPWDGKVRITVDPAESAEFAICLRIPGWSRHATTGLDDGRAPARTVLQDGYARIQRKWKRGDVANLELPMPIRRIAANPRVRANTGKVALQRGPLVYCLEAADNGGRVRHLTLPRDARLHAEHRPDLLGGVTAIRGTALATDNEGWDDALYQHAAEAKSTDFVAIPYYAWDNRAAGEMVVWLPESPLLLEPPPVRWVTASASHCWPSDTLLALHDRQEPESSSDHGIPRFTWWPRRGSQEWVQYDFDEPRRVSSVEVYWFDDEAAGGGCRVPASWKLLYRDGESWREVQSATNYGAELNQFNRVSFTPMETTGLRIEVQLQDEHSGGILEWRVGRE
jgi:DUF1680 family protein